MGSMALVFSVIFFSIKPGSILKVLGSISTKTGFAPANSIQFELEIKENGDVILISENSKYSPFIASKDFRIEGVVRGMITRKL